MRRSLTAGLWVLCLVLVSGCGQVWGGACLLPTADALLVMQDLAAGAGNSRLKAMTPAPTRETITYEVDGRTYEGDTCRESPRARAC